MLVHCSAGVGRTGTFLAIDLNMDRAAKLGPCVCVEIHFLGTVDVLGTLNNMRRQRSTVVQTEDQYVFIYNVLADACQSQGGLLQC